MFKLKPGDSRANPLLYPHKAMCICEWVGVRRLESSGQGAWLCPGDCSGQPLTCILFTDAGFLSKPLPSPALTQSPHLGDDFGLCDDIRP